MVVISAHVGFGEAVLADSLRTSLSQTPQCSRHIPNCFRWPKGELAMADEFGLRGHRDYLDQEAGRCIQLALVSRPLFSQSDSITHGEGQTEQSCSPRRSVAHCSAKSTLPRSYPSSNLPWYCTAAGSDGARRASKGCKWYGSWQLGHRLVLASIEPEHEALEGLHVFFWELNGGFDSAWASRGEEVA